MTPVELETLNDVTAHPGLDGLEAAVWQRVGALEAGERRLTPLASVQALLFVAAVGGSAAIGGTSASKALARNSDLGIFSPHAALAPSNRILGRFE